jgi:hypothetical protein
MRFTSSIKNYPSKLWGLNLQEAYLFSFLYELSSWAEKAIIDGKIYYHGSRKKAIEEIPLLTDKPDTIYRYYKSLREKGLIEYVLVQGKDYVTITKKGSLWNSSEIIPSDKNKSDTSENNPTSNGNFPENTSENNPTYNNTSIHNNTSINNNNDLIFSEKKDSHLLGEKEKAPQTRGARSKKVKAPFCIFQDSQFYDFENFKNFMMERYPEADANYYYVQVRDWELKDGSKPERQNWKNTIRQFISNDIQSGKLKTSKEYAEQKHKSNPETSQLFSDFFGS